MVLVLIGVNVAVFLVMAAMTGTMDWSARTLLAWGGNLGVLSLDDEPWRLVTSQYLHGNVQHIFGNMVLLAITGGYLARMMGRSTFLGVYTVCGVAAATLSAYVHPDVVGIGASGAIAGLVGIIVALWASKRYPVIRGSWVLQTVGINALYSLAPGVDWVAHLGGLAAGLLCGGVMLGVGPRALSGDRAP